MMNKLYPKKMDVYKIGCMGKNINNSDVKLDI